MQRNETSAFPDELIKFWVITNKSATSTPIRQKLSEKTKGVSDLKKKEAWQKKSVLQAIRSEIWSQKRPEHMPKNKNKNNFVSEKTKGVLQRYFDSLKLVPRFSQSIASLN